MALSSIDGYGFHLAEGQERSEALKLSTFHCYQIRCIRRANHGITTGGRRLKGKEPEACLPGITSIRIFTSYPVSSNVWRGRMRSHQKMTRKVPCLLRSDIKPQSCPPLFFFCFLLLHHPPPLRPTHQPHTTNIITRRLHLNHHHHHPNPCLIIYKTLCNVSPEISPFSVIRAKPMEACRMFSPTMTSVILLSYSDGERKSCAFLFF